MTKLDEFKYDNLFAGSAEVVTDSIEVDAALSKGTVIALKGGKAVAVDSSDEEAKDPYGILAENVGDGEESTIYLTGEFNSRALVVGGEDEVNDYKQALRKIGIFVKENL